ncbi:hypothetical protein Moror_11272 [Moniliophthora roreri MCA 2997]|uniref:Uncharacterized protein n=1 Tax=Moniliophthora roreri (strain MCA 2997) TaxID=1381753 RepID=V2WHA5_MONRO|nr:hypothetical protein Moror_11272 [Moniliophthora roreri MCA 2997]
MEYQVKDPKDSAEPHKAEHEACCPDQSAHSNSVPPASTDTDMVMADMAKNVDHMEVRDHARAEPSRQGLCRQSSILSVSIHFPPLLNISMCTWYTRALEMLCSPRLTRFPKGLVWQAILPATEASIHHLFHFIVLISFISGATDEGSLFHTVEELQQELLLLPFGSIEAKSTLTLMSLYNATTAALASHLFSVHKAMQDYKDTLVTRDEISRILHDCHITLLSPQAYDTKDIDMPMAQ